MNEDKKKEKEPFVLSYKTPLHNCKSIKTSRCCSNTTILLCNVGLKGYYPLKIILFKMNEKALFYKTYKC